MIISSWNVNSVRARIENIKEYLKKYSPDILMMQEIKAQDENYPYEDFEKSNYQNYVFGQKSYNGVAIISKKKLEKIEKDIFKDKNKQSRIITADLKHKSKTIKLINIYTPNGNPVDTEKYIKWLKSTPSIDLDKHINIKDNKITKTLESIIDKSYEMEFIEEKPDVKSLSGKLLGLNQIINDYYLLLINNVDKKKIKSIFKKYRYQGRAILNEKEINKILEHSTHFVYIISNIGNLNRILHQVYDQLKLNPDLNNGVLKDVP